RVLLADSFAGLPAPDDRFPADAGSHLHEVDQLAVSLEEVRANFERYGLLDERVEFVRGWFADTLPALRERRWAVVRLDGDLYESTIQALENLYPGLSPGGFLIVDDYGALESCRRAVEDFRREQGIAEPLRWIDHSGVYWRRSP
ncbi:MAG TPA: TylF/MycF/NovP-related O-methyltransferase, partial [Solirubrobacterales bacterium]|nr:TylF/MycF/NovP-related O-methyltransferase [Solirubrobacterales bacterium]